MESIQSDATFLSALYKRFSYLQDYPCEFQGICIEEAESQGIIQSDGFLGALLGYPKEACLLRGDHFPYLPVEVNRQITNYRQFSPVQPWPQPIIGVAMKEDQGQVSGIHRVPVMLRSVGNAQVWYGGEVGLIFEAFLGSAIQAEDEFESLINQLWILVESYLQHQGVRQIYTLAREPEFDDSWYQGHLERRGYQPLHPHSVVWVNNSPVE